MGQHIIDVMDDGRLIVDSVDYVGVECSASLSKLLRDLESIGIKASEVTATKKTSMLANPNRNRVRSG